MHVKQLVIQATETAGRHCLHQTYLKFVTYHMDIITQNAKEVNNGCPEILESALDCSLQYLN